MILEIAELVPNPAQITPTMIMKMQNPPYNQRKKIQTSDVNFLTENLIVCKII